MFEWFVLKLRKLVAPNFDPDKDPDDLPFDVTPPFRGEQKFKDLNVHEQVVWFQRRGMEVPFYLRRASTLDCLLRAARLPDIVGAKILCSGNPGICDKCKSDDGKVFPINDEIARPHLPHKGCTCPGDWCSCYYEVVFNDDL